jgi:hypothetical protein
MPKKSVYTQLYIRRRNRPKNYVPPLSPARRRVPWVSVSIRAEHYAMLRELGEYYDARLSSLTATLITGQFLRVLAKTDPEQALKLREELKHEKYVNDIVDLDV